MKYSYISDMLRYILRPEETWDSYYEIPRSHKVRDVIKFFVWFFVSIAAGIMMAKTFT